MKVEQRFFLDLINSQLNGKKIEQLPSEIDSKVLFDLGARHSLLVMLYYALKPFEQKISKSFLDYLKIHATKEIAKTIKKQLDVQSLIENFEKNNVKFLMLKGYWLKDYYPVSEMRYTSDYDILIEEDKIEDIKSLMKQLGYTFMHEDAKHVAYCSTNMSVAYELHKKIFLGKLKDSFGVGFERAIPNGDSKNFYKLTPEDFYLSILGHAAVHFSENAGVGVRSVIDIYLFNRANKNLDKEYLSKLLEKCALTDFSKEMQKLGEFWFDGQKPSEFTLKLSEHILSSSMLENKDSFGANKIIKSESGKDLSKSKKTALYRKIFPTLKEMCYLYPSLKKCKIHLPFMHVIRWLKILFTRPKALKQLKTISNVEQGQVASLREIQLGLGIKDVSMFEE